MQKNRVFIICIVLVALLCSCELKYKDSAERKIWYVGYGADFKSVSEDSDHTGQSISSLLFSTKDAIEVGKAFESLAKDRNVPFEAIYFINDDKRDMDGDPRVHDCYWTEYESTLDSFLDPGKDDIVIFFFSGHGSSDAPDIVGYQSTAAFNENCILFYEKDGSYNRYVAIPFAEVDRVISKYNGSKFVICDTCFSGSFIVGDGVSVNRDVYKKDPLPVEILFGKDLSFEGKKIEKQKIDITASSEKWYLTACTLYQESTEPHSSPYMYMHGGLTYFVLQAIGWNEDTQTISRPKALDGKILSVGSIANYIYKNGGKYTYGGNEQTPVFGAGSSDLVLFKF